MHSVTLSFPAGHGILRGGVFLRFGANFVKHVMDDLGNSLSNSIQSSVTFTLTIHNGFSDSCLR